MAIALALSETKMGKPRCVSASCISDYFTFAIKPEAKVSHVVEFRVNLEHEYKENIIN